MRRALISSIFRRGAALLTLVTFGGGCAAVRPVTLNPSLPGPSSYVSQYDATPPRAVGAPEPLPQRPSNESAESDEDDPTDPGAETSATPGPWAEWWSVFADPALDAAIQESLHHNYLIRDLRNLIYENQLEPTMPRGFLWPLQVGLPGTVQHVTTAAPPAVGNPAYGLAYDVATIGVTASYELDVFGKLDVQRRTFEDLVEQQRQNTEILAQSLAEQVAQLWFEILEQRALRVLLQDQVRYSQDLLGVLKARFDQHLVPRLVVLQQEQLLLNTQSQEPLVVARLALLNSKLTSLLGRTPSPSAELVPYDRQLPNLPPAPPVGAPGDLLRQSPELRLAQSRVAEAEHLVSQNLASWLPTVELFGNAGVQSYELASSQTFATAAAGARLTWPIFDGGQRITKAKQLELTVERRTWQYQLAFNSAIQRVQDSLIEERKQADSLRSLRAQVDLGRRVLDESRQLFLQGLSDYLPVLTALNNLSNLERASIQAQRLLLSYRVQLYHALGGNWSNAATKIVH